MKLITRIAFATLLTTGFSITAQAADVKAASTGAGSYCSALKTYQRSGREN